jgi:hypothetical protein
MVTWQALVDLINGRNSAGFSMRFLVSSFLFFSAVEEAALEDGWRWSSITEDAFHLSFFSNSLLINEA